MNLIPRYDNPRPKTLKVTGRTRKSLQTDGQTDGQHHTIIRPVKDGRIKMFKLIFNENDNITRTFHD